MKSIVFSIKQLAYALFYDLAPAVKAFALLLWKIFSKCLHKKQGKVPRHSCTRVAHPAIKRPDPMIYSQYYLMSLGLAVSWQNPDITILENGVPVASAYNLQPSTLYTIRATIYNASTSGIVHDMPVSFFYLSFGIGTAVTQIDPTPPTPPPTVTLGVKGTPQGIAVAEMPWTTPAVPGHYCILVSFSYFNDLNPFNNLGQENTQVVKAASPAGMSFQLRNAARVRREF